MAIISREAKNAININPIQRGGILTEDARKTLIEFGDGYSVCDFCLKGQLHEIKKPNICGFHEDLAKWLNVSEVRITPGNRIAQRIVFNVLKEENGIVVLDSNAHYTTYLAIEGNNLKVKEVPHNGYPEYKIDEEMYANKIESAKKEGNVIGIFATHVDSYYGNLLNVKKISKIAKEYDIPFILNCAYTMGIMPLNAKELEADVLIGSGHKSMASSAPIGILAVNEIFAEKLFKKSSIQGDLSGRAFPEKEIEMLGCTVMGAPLMTLIASFPHVKERVKNFDKEVENANYFVEKIEKIGKDTMQLGIKPKKHTLIHFEVLDFHWCSSKHKNRGFFVYEALKKRNIYGTQPGKSKDIKVNTFGLKKEEIEYVINAFYEIAKENGIEVEE